jgi:hypothetical protein
MSDGGLEDLFGGADEVVVEEPQEVAAKPRSRSRRLLGNAALIIIATVVTVAGLRSRGISVSVLLVVAAFVALRLLMLAVSEVAPPPAPARRRARRAERDGGQLGPGTDTLRAAVRRWERGLEWSQSDADKFSRNVLPVLIELADERLRLKHGITRSSDPRRARELLGEPLWELLGASGRRPPKARDLPRYVEALEEI